MRGRSRGSPTDPLIGSTTGFLPQTGKEPRPCVGAAVFPVHGTDAEELLSVADKRMYKNKAENKKRLGIPSRGDVLPQAAGPATQASTLVH